MAYRFNPAPGWPAPPEGWTPPEGWQPDPTWPPAPEGWEFWVWDEGTPESAPAQAPVAQEPPVGPETPVSEPVMPPVIPPVVPPVSSEEPPDDTREPETPVEEPAEQWGEARPEELAPEPPAVPSPSEAPTQQWQQAEAQEQESQQSWDHWQPGPQQPAPAPEHQRPQQYAQQPQQFAQQPVHHAPQTYQSPPPAASPKKKGKGLLVILIVLALILAAAFAWALMRSLSSNPGASADAPPAVEEATPVEPVEELTEPEAAEPEPVEFEEVDASEEEVMDLEQLATEAGLLDYLVAQNELEVRPAEMRGDAVKLGSSDRADLTTFMVGPGPSLIDQEVGTLGIDDIVRNWEPDGVTGNPCPPPGPGNEYIKLTLNAETAPALQDYGFTGLELRFFGEDGNETGMVDSLLTIVCLGEYEAITSDWARSGGYMGGVLAEVGQETTTLAYSSIWSYGVDDAIYRWELADF